MSRRSWITVLLVVLLAAGAALVAWRLLRGVPIELATVRQGSLPLLVTGPGTVQARVPVTISARLTSTLVAVAADVGDAVRRGQLLAELDARDLVARRAAVSGQQESLARQVEAADAAVAKAQAELELAVTRRDRDTELHAQGVVSLASLDTSLAAARAAQAALRSAQATSAARRADQHALRQEGLYADTLVGHTRLNAPMDGIVVQRLAEPGTTVAPGTPILRLVDPRTLWVATRVDEALVERVRPGQPATIRLRSGTVLAGRGERVALQSDAATRELDVHVAFAAVPERIAIDQEADVRIEAGRASGLLVPLAALARDGSGRQGVLQVRDGRARFVPVDSGAAADGQVLVRGALKEGDAVVADAARAKAGTRVRPLVR